MSKKKSFIAAAAVSVLAAFLVYVPSLGNGFVLWDDDQYVLDNRLIRTLDFAFLKKAFTTVAAANYHPLTVISYAVDFRLWGLDPFWYHLENIVLHALNTLLVFLLASKLYGMASGARGREGGPRAFAGLVAALLFALHPLHVESVAWISERKDVLYAFFYLLAALTYLRYAGGGRGKGLYYLLTLALFGLSLLSKPMAITLPLALLILDFYPLGRFHDAFTNFRVVAEKLPLFVMAAAAAGLTVWAQRAETLAAPLPSVTAAARAAGAIRAYAFYLYKTVLPFGLAPLYPRPVAAFDLAFVLSAVAVIGLTALAFRRKALIAAWLFYIVTLLPVSGLVQAGDQAAADRYAYLPLLGFFILAGSFAAGLYVRRKITAVALAVVVAAFLSALTVRQAGIWKDSISLWSWELDLYPKNSRAYNQRGLAYIKLGEYAQAIDDFGNAIRVDPGTPVLYFNRGNAYAETGDFRSAIEDYSSAIRLDPGLSAAYFYRAFAYGRLARYNEALEDYNAVIRLRPSPSAYAARGTAKMALGDWAGALADLKTAVALAPDNAEAWWNMGVAASRLGDAKGAEQYYSEARKRGFSGGGR